MKTLIAAVVMITLLTVSAFAQCSRCGMQSCTGSCYQPCATVTYQPCATTCYQPCSTKCYQPPTVPTCYRTVDSQCLRWDLGVGRVLGYMFAPGCMPECQPCQPCATPCATYACATYQQTCSPCAARTFTPTATYTVRAARTTTFARPACSSCSR